MLKKILQELILIKEALKDIQTNKRIVKEFAVKSCEDCHQESGSISGKRTYIYLSAIGKESVAAFKNRRCTN